MVRMRRRKLVIGRLLHGRLHSPHLRWQSLDDLAWDNMVPVGREFGRPGVDQQMQMSIGLEIMKWRRVALGELARGPSGIGIESRGA
jgi:hypothetical protein